MKFIGRDDAIDYSPARVPSHILVNLVCLLMVTLAGIPVFGQSDPQRPPLLGIAHVAVFESDLGKARIFYKEFLGFAEPFSLKGPNGTDWLVSIKVNDQQYLELFAGTTQNGGHISHFALYTNDVSSMQRYLASHGVPMVDQIHNGQTGDRFFTIKDPDGHFIEIVEYQPKSWTGRERGKSMPAERVSSHISQVGILVGQSESAMNFYRNILGFQEISRNSVDEKQLRWVDMRVPEGTDSVELMLDPGPSSSQQHKALNHISLVGNDVQKIAGDLQSRAAAGTLSRPLQIETGSNQTRMLNLVDPDGTRIEIVELTHE